MSYRTPALASVARLAICAVFLAAACAPSAPPNVSRGPADQSSGAAAAPARPKVDRVVMAVVTPATEGNAPGRAITAPEAVQLRPMYEKLVGVDPRTGKLIPQLATEWSLEPDGKSYRFRLRQGVQFHKGHGEFTARDVVWTWEDITAPDSVHSNSLYFRTLVEQVEVVNDYEVVFRMKEPDADFLNNVGEMVGGMEIQSKAHFDKVGHPPSLQEEPIAGTGPYQFKERVQGQYIRFERVPYQHWRVTPDFPELELRWMTEASTRMAALLAGEVHMTPLPTDLEKEVLRQSNFKVLKSNVAGLRTFMPFLCCYHNDIGDRAKGSKYPDSPLMNVNVRRAINHAVNRDELNRAFFGGKGELMYMNNLHPTLEGWNPDWEKRFPEAWGYNPDKAKQLLAEAGYGPGRPVRIQMIPLRLTDVPESPDVVEAVAGYLRAVGVEVELVNVDTGTHNTKRRNLGYDRAIDIRSTASHPLVGWKVYNTSRHGLRGSGVEIFEIDDLYRRASATMDDAQRAAIWKQIGDRSFEQYQQINLFWLPTEVVVNANIVADYTYPGNISGSWTHLETIKAAR